MLQLSKRLQAVVNLICPGEERYACIADVGCDHGYIPIYMVEQGITKKAIAMDINQGPLQRAREHIQEHGLRDYIETRLSDGLLALEKDEAQAIVIAGMGGATMQEILLAKAEALGPDTVLALQPQSELREFRSFLACHGFSILAEDMVCEEGKYYPMMRVQKAKREESTEEAAYSEMELRFGPLLLARRHPVLQEFLLWQLVHKQAIRESLLMAGKDGEACTRRKQRIAQVEEDLSYILRALKEYQ